MGDNSGVLRMPAWGFLPASFRWTRECLPDQVSRAREPRSAGAFVDLRELTFGNRHVHADYPLGFPWCDQEGYRALHRRIAAQIIQGRGSRDGFAFFPHPLDVKCESFGRHFACFLKS